MHFGGPKLRLKWLPVQTDDSGHGWFAGANLEYAFTSAEFEQSTRNVELRPIIGYRNRDWLIAANPILGWSLNGPDHDGKADFSPAVKMARSLSEGLSVGMEYYADLGKLNRRLPRSEQGHTLFFTLDIEYKGWEFNVGIGRGLTDATDRWTLKTIFAFPFD